MTYPHEQEDDEHDGGNEQARPIILTLSPGYVRASARLHHEVLDMEFVARAGERFLRLYHSAWVQSDGGLALAALDGRGELTGVLLGALDPALHYRSILRRYGPRLGLCLLANAAVHPRFARELLVTRARRYIRGLLRAAFLRSSPTPAVPEARKTGEVAHIMVRPSSRGIGAGGALLNEALGRGRAAGLSEMMLVTPPDLESRGFYEHLGWQPAGEVTSRSGERFVRYRWDFGPELHAVARVEREGDSVMHVTTRSDVPASAGSSEAPASSGEPLSSEALVLRQGGFRHRRLRHSWDLKARTWDHGASPDLEAVVQAVLDKAQGAQGAQGLTAVDVGCGTGSLTLPLAAMGAQVIAVDVSSVMIAQLREKAAGGGLRNVTCVLGPVEDFDLPPESVDLVVSNYALHHLRDGDKEKLVRSASRWLRPGGRFVAGDIMLGRGRTRRDREIIVSKASVFLRRGLPGWWRLAKNLVRFGLHVGERPVDMMTWQSYLRRAGFCDVSAEPVVSEAGVVAGTKPLAGHRPGDA